MKLYTMEGVSDQIDVTKLSDIEAGIHYFTTVNKIMPNITWREFNNPELMGGWWTSLKKATSSVVRGIGDTAGGIVNFTGRKLGEATRLVTDEKVIDTITRAGAAYATGGGSEGIRAAGRSITGSTSSGGLFGGLLSKVGSFWKRYSGSAPITPPIKTIQPTPIKHSVGVIQPIKKDNTLLYAGAAGAAILLIIMMTRKK